MRYFLQDCLYPELQARQEYLFEALQLYTVSSQYNTSFYQLTSMPAGDIDVCFIVGHNVAVKKFILSEQFPETTIVAITCDGSAKLSKLRLKGKRIYLAKQNAQGLADLLRGEEYGFGFNPTESEVLFYNTSKKDEIDQRLRASFTLL